jgi:hypothetical protein
MGSSGWGSREWGKIAVCNLCPDSLFLIRACLRSRILALQAPKFYLAGSKKSRKSGFLRSIDRKNPHLEQAITLLTVGFIPPAGLKGAAPNIITLREIVPVFSASTG